MYDNYITYIIIMYDNTSTILVGSDLRDKTCVTNHLILQQGLGSVLAEGKEDLC